MVETDRPNGVESAEVIFVWNEIAVPGDNVQRRMIERHCPEVHLKLLHDLRRSVPVLIPCLRRFDVGSDRKSVGSGQRVAVRVEFGCCRIIKEKKCMSRTHTDPEMFKIYYANIQ